jgi:phospholipid/cholesterol/gamma-HCH transport system substrate-binding protein
MVTKILPRLDRVLRDMEIFADKLARHPELIGLGGALRPSSGMKETPPYRIYP